MCAVPGGAALWGLPAKGADGLGAPWADGRDNGDSWAEFFDELKVQAGDLLTALRARDLLDLDHDAQVSRMRRSAEGRSVPISSIRHVDDDTITLLAAGFSRGETGKPAIPYARVDG